MNYEDVDFSLTLPDGGIRYRLLESGAVQDRATGKIVARRLSSDEAREMTNKRWDKYREATASRILREAQAIEPDIKTVEQAYALLVAKTFTAIMDSDKPRGRDLETVGRAMGAAPTIADLKQPQDTDEMEYYKVIREIARFAGEIVANARETVEGRVIDDDK